MKSKIIISVFIVFFPFIQCMPEIGRLKITPGDKEALPAYDTEKAYIQNSKILLTHSLKCSASEEQKISNELLNSMITKYAMEIPGIEVVDRAHLPAILNEILLQESGIISGKVKNINIKGADYLVTYCMQEIKISSSYRPGYWTSDANGNKYYVPPTTVFYMHLTVNLNAIELETAKIIFSLTRNQKFTISGMEEKDKMKYLPSALNDILHEMKFEVQNSFPVKTIIIAMKGGKKIAMIPLGSEHNVKSGMKFKILREEMIETIIGEKKYYTQTVGYLDIFQVNENESWGVISGNKKDIKLGSTVIAKSVHRSGWSTMRGIFSGRY